MRLVWQLRESRFCTGRGKQRKPDARLYSV
jgi:hypothetical protein